MPLYIVVFSFAFLNIHSNKMTSNRTLELEQDELRNGFVEPEDRFVFEISIIIFMAIIGSISLIIYASFPPIPDVLDDKPLESLTNTDSNGVDHRHSLRQTMRQTLIMRKIEKDISDLDEKINSLCALAKTLNMLNSVIKNKCF